MLPAAYRSSRTVARSMRLAGKSAKEIRKAQIGRFSSKLRQGRQYAVSLSSRGQTIGATVTSTTRTETIASDATRKTANKIADKLVKTEDQIAKYAGDPTKAKKVAKLEEKAAQLEQELQRLGTQTKKAAQTLEKDANKLSKRADRLRRQAGKRSGKTGDRLRHQADDLEQQAAALREQANQIRRGTGSYATDVTRAGYKYAGPRAHSSQREADRWARRMRNKMKGQTPQNNVGWNVSQHRLGYDLREIYIDAAKYRLEYANPGSWRRIVDNAKFWNAFIREGGEFTSVMKSALPIKIGGRTLLTLPFDPLADFKLASEASTLAMVGKGIQNMDGSIAFFTSKGEPATFEQVWAVMKDAPENLLKNRQEFLRFLEIKPGATASDVEQALNKFRTDWIAWQAAYEKAATRLAGGKIPVGKQEEYYHMIDEMILAEKPPQEFLAFENPLTDFQRFQAVFKTYESTSPEFFYAVPRANFPGGKIPTNFDPEKTPGVTRIVQNMIESPTSSTLIGAEAPAVEFISKDPVQEIKQMHRFLRDYNQYSGLTPFQVFHNNWLVSQVRNNFVMFSALDLTTDRWLYTLMEKQTDYRSDKQYKKAQLANDPTLTEKQNQLGYVDSEDDASNLFSRLYSGRSRLNERLFTTYSFMWPVPSQNPIPDLLWSDLLTDEDRANIQVESIRTNIDYLTTLRDWNTKVQETNNMLASKRADYKKARALATDPAQIQILDTLLATLDQEAQDFRNFSTDLNLTFTQKNARYEQWIGQTKLTTAEDDFQREAFATRVATARMDLTETRQDYEYLLQDDTDGIYTELIKRVLSEMTKVEQHLDAIVASDKDVYEKHKQMDAWFVQPQLNNAIEALNQKQFEEETADYLESLNQQRQSVQAKLTGQELADKLADIDQTEQALREIMQKPGTVKQKHTAWSKWQTGHFNEKAEKQHQRLEDHFAQLKRQLDRAIVHGNSREVKRVKKALTQQEQYATLLRNIRESSANVSYKNLWLAWWENDFPTAAELFLLQEQLSFVNADEKTRQEWITAQTSLIRSGILYSPVEKYAFLTEQLETVTGHSEDACASVLLYGLEYSSHETTYPDLSDEDKDFWAKHQIDSALLQLTEGPFSFGKKIEAFGEDAIAQRDELWRSTQEKIDNVYNDKKLTLQQKQTQYAAIRSSFSLDIQTLWNGLATAAQRETDELLPDETSATSPIIH